MEYLTFDGRWFKKHQKIILFLLQFKLFKAMLRIDSKDKIIAILPHAYLVNRGGNNYQADFRTHWKYSKRIYHSFKYLWWLMHVWDLFADKYVPTFSFGFSTLTVYPDPHPGVTSFNGQAGNIGTAFITWADIHSSSGDTSTDSSSQLQDFFIQTSSTRYDGLYRSLFLFDTSPLGSSSSVTSATFSLFGVDKNDGLSISPNLALVSSNPASNTAISNTDFSTLGTTDFASRISYASWSIVAYNDMALNASGIAAISLTGDTKFGVRNGNYDLDNVDPGLGNNSSSLGSYFANQAGTTKDPKLVVNYTAISTGAAFLLNFI